MKADIEKIQKLAKDLRKGYPRSPREKLGGYMIAAWSCGVLCEGPRTVARFLSRPAGIQEVGRVFNGAAAALTAGRTHHELLLIQAGDAPGPPAGRYRELYHIGIKNGLAREDIERRAYELYLARGGAGGTPSRIGSSRSGSSKQDNHNCEVDRLEIPRMGFQGKVVIVGEKRVAAVGSRSPPLRQGSFSYPMKRVKPMEK